MSIGGLKVGVNVDIQRSDGRIHSAVISSVNEETQSVTVEWYERGETKGKEIEVDQIFELNQDLAPQAAPPPARPPAKAAGIKKPAARKVPQTNGTNQRVPSSRSRPSYAARPTSQSSQLTDDRQGGEPSSSRIMPPPAGAAKGSRKSNCVKEVEQIQQRREERRARAAAAKDQVQQDYDTSAPNWQFLAMIREYQEQLEYRPITLSDPIYDHQICVCVRKRPLSKKEIEKKEVDVATVPNKENVIIHEPKHKVDLTKYLENQQFRFDYAFDENASNEMVYRYTAKPLVESIFEQGMATCFAYGQTGSGKTHTMGGDFESRGKQDASKGIYMLAARDVFKLLGTKYKKTDVQVSASFFEIYSGKVFDLLNKKQKLRVLEDHKNIVQVVGLREELVENVDDVLKLIHGGTSVRTSGTTSANQHSSRSHAVFQIILRKRTTKKLWGKFSLVDLAGNERGADTSSADRQTRMEGAEINKSLLALKECIRALGKEGPYVPFRASKLTQVLRDSFIGNKSRTCMIATISPSMNSCEHTLNTLRYADRVKELGPGGPVEGKPSEVREMSQMGSMSPQNSDLAILRTVNQEALPDELLNFHQCVNQMQELEEEMVETHRATVEEGQKWNAEHRKLLKQSDTVDYDTEVYASQLDSLLDRQIQALMKLKERVGNYRGELAEEEKISQTIKGKRQR